MIKFLRERRKMKRNQKMELRINSIELSFKKKDINQECVMSWKPHKECFTEYRNGLSSAARQSNKLRSETWYHPPMIYHCEGHYDSNKNYLSRVMGAKNLIRNSSR
jgi:hypothetical protein